ncbi:MAG: class I SAM-dependent methyltransferase [Pseudomonadota bacterium]
MQQPSLHFGDRPCPCPRCADMATADEHTRHRAIRSLLDYVAVDRRAFFASQLDQLSVLGERDDTLLEQICELTPGAIAPLRLDELGYATHLAEQLDALAGDAPTRERLRHYWQLRLDWRDHLRTTVQERHSLRLELRGRSWHVEVPASLDSYLLLFEIFLSQPYRGMPAVPVVYDLGANIGLSALYFHAHLPQARLVCVEPVAENLAFLEENLRRNGIAAEVRAEAVAAEDGELALQVCTQAPSLSSRFALRDLASDSLAALSTERRVVPARSLRSLLTEDQAGIKLDIEGGEHALASLGDAFASARWVAGELHVGPGLSPPERAFDLLAQLARDAELDVAVPGVFGDTVTYTFRAVRPFRLRALSTRTARGAKGESPLASPPPATQALSASQRLAIVAQALDGDSSAPPTPYRYPDAEEAQPRGSFPIATRQAETALWLELVERARARSGRADLALDAGCGWGYYTAQLARRYAAVIAVDADPLRVEQARATLAADDTQVHFAVLGLEDDRLRHPSLRGQFDLVLCAQVLGHVAVGQDLRILQTLTALLAPGSAVLLSVPYTNLPVDDFRAAAPADDGKMRGRISNPGEFEQLVRTPSATELPVRHYAMPTILGALKAVGLHVEEHHPCSWYSYEHADLWLLARRP